MAFQSSHAHNLRLFLSDIIKIRNTFSIYDLLVDTLFTAQPPGSYRQLKYCQHASEPEHEITIIIIWMLTVSNQPDMHKNDDSVKFNLRGTRGDT